MAFLRHKLGKTYYQTFGKRSDEHLPIICLHGGPGGSHFSFGPLKKLAKQRQVILYDQIGSGRSSPLKKKDQTIATLVEDLDRLVKKLKVEKFYLLGTSWGGSLALEYYFRKKGQGVASLILQSPLVSTKLWERDARDLLKTLTAKEQKVIALCLEAGATDAKVYKEAEKAFYKKFVYRGKPQPARASYFKRYPNGHGHQLYMHMWGPSEFTCEGTLKRFDRAKDLHKIRVPTLFLCGQYDEARPATLKSFSRKIKDCRVEVIPKASHAILGEEPKEYVQRLNAFLAGYEG